MNDFRDSVSVTGLVILLSLSLALESAGQGTTQNPTDSKQTPAAGSQQAAPNQDFSKNHWEIPADADKTQNAVPATEESISKGKEIYFAKKGNCVFCHGETGAGNEENLPKLRRKPADLSNKERMPKLSDGEIFWKMSLGIPGIMPGREKQLTEEERWHVVNYVRTLAK